MNQSTSALQRENKAKDKLTRQIQEEGLDWLATVVWVAIILSLVFAATFCHTRVSRAQADPMPVLYTEMFVPWVGNEVQP